jgi:serine O-acetyltransferase
VDTSPDNPVISEGMIARATRRVTTSILADQRTRHLSTAYLPNRREILRIMDELHTLLFPGFFGPRDLSEDTVQTRVSDVLTDVSRSLHEQISGALRYEKNIDQDTSAFEQHCEACDGRAGQVMMAFLDELPEIRRKLSLDVQAAYDGDPAARHTDEAIFCYPGIRALAVHRVAHELYRHNVPLIPRILAESAHSVTGIDIHPGASIGTSFFIDHGTGVVIGETTRIGEHCKLYQGVTLGAKAFLKDDQGKLLRDVKRHPTLEDHVTVYAGATILGGDTVIGAGSVINGGVFLTHSVPPGHVVRAPRVELTLRNNPEMPPGAWVI